jgi:hypothetical protein
MATGGAAHLRAYKFVPPREGRDGRRGAICGVANMAPSVGDLATFIPSFRRHVLSLQPLPSHLARLLRQLRDLPRLPSGRRDAQGGGVDHPRAHPAVHRGPARRCAWEPIEIIERMAGGTEVHVDEVSGPSGGDRSTRRSAPGVEWTDPRIRRRRAGRGARSACLGSYVGSSSRPGSKRRTVRRSAAGILTEVTNDEGDRMGR